MTEQVFQDLHEVLQNRSRDLDQFEYHSIDAKLGRFWKSALNNQNMQDAGITPLLLLLGEIDAVRTVGEFQQSLGKLHQLGVNALFKIDLQASNLRLLPSATFEDMLHGVGQASKYTKVVRGHQNAIAKKMQFTGMSKKQSKRAAKAAGKLEIELCHRRNFGSAESAIATTTLADYFREIGLMNVSSVVVADKQYFEFLEKDIVEDNLPKYKNYLKWQVLHHFEWYLEVVFPQKQLMGRKNKRFWKELVIQLQESIPEILGKLYCDVYYTHEISESILALVDDLKFAFHQVLGSSRFMAPGTQKEAQTKLSKLEFEIGCPSSFTLENVEFPLNEILLHHIFEMKYTAFEAMIKRIASNTEWNGTRLPPFIPKIQYTQERNQLYVTAAILQPPMFKPSYDAAVNYGTIATIIGREMILGFDAVGHLFDAQGEKKEWWQQADKDRYQDLSYEAIRQYRTPQIGFRILRQNLADIGGLRVFYDALERKHTRVEPTELIDGFTSKQRFFIAYAQTFATNERKNKRFHSLQVHDRIPPRIQAVGALRNLDEFYSAFSIPSVAICYNIAYTRASANMGTRSYVDLTARSG